MVSIKVLVASGRKVRFTHFKNGELWYVTETGFAFPVSVTDTKEIGDATFQAEDKALLFMRYIRKHLDMLEKARTE
jgi:hypothetical protein